MKTILITGGSSGIGRDMAIHFSKNYKVIITYNKSEKEAKELLEYKINIYKIDISSDDCINKINDILSCHTVDILINNAGILSNSLLHKMSPFDWNNVLDTNLKSIYYTTNPVIKKMLDKGIGGHIINISSVSGLKGSKGQTNYCSSKFGIIGFTKSLALEYSDKNILVNCVCPGLVDTPMISFIDENVKKKIISSLPIKKIIPQHEITKMVELLINSEYITGSIFSIDCGMSL